jgi:glycosyltransferase involved in cell wall biosynthesis
VKISIVIPCSDAKLLKFCLLGISLQDKQFIEEIIVVEDWVYSDYHASERLCEKFSTKYFRLPSPKKNRHDVRICECRGMGMKAAKGEIILFLDQDCILCDGYLKRLSDIHLTHDKLIFSAERIFLNENSSQLNESNWMQIVHQWKYRINMVEPFLQ